MKVAIVEDERKLTESLAEGLTAEGYVPSVYFDGESFLADSKKGTFFDVIILDLGLPRMNGKKVSEVLRGDRVVTPILILTAHDTISDKVEALDSGADDFLAKPFNFDELMARLRALKRRTIAQNEVTNAFEDLLLDVRTREVKRAGANIVLTPTEFDLLLLLLQNRSRPLSREEISNTFWDVRDASLSNIVDVHISNLRKKIDGPYAKKYIATVRGLGYQIA